LKFSFPKVPLAVLLLFTVLGSALAFLPAPVFAQNPSCGATITANTTLSANVGPCVGKGLVIGANGITLNCAGYAIRGTGGYVGVNLTGIREATVENCNVTGFNFGFGLYYPSFSNTFTGNTESVNYIGFFLSDSFNNTFTGNTGNDNPAVGFLLSYSYKNTFTGNTANENPGDGFYLGGYANSNTFTGNTANSNDGGGFVLDDSSNSNILTRNTANDNRWGFYLLDSSASNTLAWNTANYNSESGYNDTTSGSGTAATGNFYTTNTCVGNGLVGSSPSGLCGYISLSPSLGLVGTVVTISGSSPVTSHSLTVMYDGSTAGMPTTCTTDASGDISPGCTFTVPSSIPGPHVVTVTDGTNSLTATFTVAHPISLSPSLGAVGTSVTITGFGLLASQSLTVTYDGSATGMPTTCTTDASGNVSSGCIFKVPTSISGDHTITVSDGTNNPTTTFTVTLLRLTCDRSKLVVGQATYCKATVHESSTAAPTGHVTWSSSSPGKFSRTSCQLLLSKSYSYCRVLFTATAAGSSAILTANYGGDLKNPATAGGFNLVVKMKATTTTVSCAPKSVVAGSPTTITCKATVIGYHPTGTVSWSQIGTSSVSLNSTTCTLASSKNPYRATCSVTMTGTTAGMVTLQGTYGGNPNNLSSHRKVKLAVKPSTTAALSCGSAITTDAILGGNLGPCSSNGLVIGASGITLNCAGNTITGSGVGIGVNLTDVKGVTVENCNVTGFQYGFHIAGSSDNTFAGNAADDNTWYGFYLSNSSNYNTLTTNTANNNARQGIRLYYSSYNTLTGNTANSNIYGFCLSASSGDTLSGNTADNNVHYGFNIAGTTSSTFTENTANNNLDVGIIVASTTSGNIFTGNTANDNSVAGFMFAPGSSNNTLTGNTADNNTGYGYSDASTGSGTAGTASFYSGDECSGNGIAGSTPSGLGSPQP